MPTVDQIITAINPALSIPRRDWLAQWRAQEGRAFKTTARFLTFGFCIVYVSHYFLVDLPEQKKPIEWYQFYRFSVGAVTMAAFLLTFSKKLSASSWMKLPVFIALAYTVHMQGESMTMRAEVPFFYVPLFSVFGAYVLRYSLFGTLASYSLILLSALPSFFARPGDTHHMVSGSIVGAVLLGILRSKYSREITTFVLQKQHEEDQIRLVESQMAMTEQLRSFLPIELFRRVEKLMSRNQMTALQAVDEVIRPKRSFASVIYSDIRGFTQLSKESEIAVINEIFPGQKEATEIVASRGGVPRLAGDLIFAYFDREDPIENLQNAVRAGVELIDAHDSLNQRVAATSGSQGFKRYVIISAGPVISGNIGATESARDISVVGPPANIGSRIDELTKDSNFAKEHLNENPVILTCEAMRILSILYPSLSCRSVNLDSIGKKVRDFPEEKEIFLVPRTIENKKILQTAGDRSKAGQILSELKEQQEKWKQKSNLQAA